MADSINTQVTYIADYATRSTNYAARLTGTWIPTAEGIFNGWIKPVKTASIGTNTATYSTGVLQDDRIIALLAASLVDQETDKIHIDPETGLRIDKNYALAENLFLSIYGIPDSRGSLKKPSQMYNVGDVPFGNVGAVDSSQGTPTNFTHSSAITMSYL